MPFGLKNAPAHFQRIVSSIFAGLENVMAYIDDIIVISETFEEHVAHLREVFSIIKAKNLTVKPSKCRFFQHEVEFPGHFVGRGLLSPLEAKVHAITHYVRLVTKRGIRSFLGLINYYRRFVKNYSQIASPLYDMTTKDSPDELTWTPETDSAFNQLKTALTSDSILLAPDFSKPFTLTTDASYSGIGAVLSQQDSEGYHRPIAYHSRKLKPAERNYSVTEIELLALVNATQHFKLYLLGTKFHVITDHKALLSAEKLFKANKRLTRWSLLLADFDFDITYKPGSLNTNADALSRQEWPFDEEE